MIYLLLCLFFVTLLQGDTIFLNAESDYEIQVTRIHFYNVTDDEREKCLQIEQDRFIRDSLTHTHT